ncbi:MAG: chromate transporter, partial [Clostridia bacterium]
MDDEIKQSKAKSLLELFLVFFKLGAFTFGGGYAMLSLLENECVHKRKWLSIDDFFKITAIAESTPGPVAINCATYVGYTKNKLLGSLIATLGVVLPSFVIIFVISLFFNKLLEINFVANAFKGIKAGVAVLILFAGVNLFKQIRKKPLDILMLIFTILACLAVNIFALKFSTIFFILIGAFIGFVTCLFANNKSKLIKSHTVGCTEGDNKENENILNSTFARESENANTLSDVVNKDNA